MDSRTKSKDYCKVVFPYEAQNNDEITIKEGDIVTLINKDCIELDTEPTPGLHSALKENQRWSWRPVASKAAMEELRTQAREGKSIIENMKHQQKWEIKQLLSELDEEKEIRLWLQMEKDRREKKHQTSARGARWDRGTQGCSGSHGDTIQGQFSNCELLIYFFHVRRILITLKRRDLIRNCSTGFLCCHFIFINT
ncbi:SH3 domain-containing kinase-binding protein 1 [Plecturocebus cupreus]